VERLKEIVEENTYRNQVMSYMKDEMPEFAEKMDQDYEAAKQMSAHLEESKKATFQLIFSSTSAQSLTV
jgi:hypothetical protein